MSVVEIQAKDIRIGEVFVKARDADVFAGESGFKVVSVRHAGDRVVIVSSWVLDNGVVADEIQTHSIDQSAILQVKGGRA